LGFGISSKLSAEFKKRESRRAPRRGYNNSAWIRLENSFGILHCQVLDISRTGVRLTVPNAHKVPNKFILLLSQSDTGALARVKWRRGNRIGAEFLSSESSNDTTARVASDDR
jgi:PilZ domain